MTGEKKPISGEKKVDERWKEEVEKDKRHVGRQAGEAGKKREASPPANFSHFISGLAIQGMIFLGEVENPATGKKEKQPYMPTRLVNFLPEMFYYCTTYSS